ncbi:MAG: hypothetical protein DHS20C20_09850 [Ardenticatenaceae bacterium]|nr:MAG: hypothetical protein DHS20C20_09850 [Ardenticatenaceae bacterium]
MNKNASPCEENYLMRSLSCVQLKDANNSLAQEAFTIYEDSFPASDRDPVDRLASLIQQSADTPVAGESIFRYWIGVSGEQVLALSIYTYHRQQRLGYLWYLATAKQYRNQGIGSWMFTSTLAKIREEAPGPPLGLCWEVERPSDAKDPHQRQISEQRIRFYEKNGSILLPTFEFLTPASVDGFPDTYYHLMYYSLQNESTISPARIRTLVDVLLLNSYGVKPSSIYYQQAIQSIISMPAGKKYP